MSEYEFTVYGVGRALGNSHRIALFVGPGYALLNSDNVKDLIKQLQTQLQTIPGEQKVEGLFSDPLP